MSRMIYAINIQPHVLYILYQCSFLRYVLLYTYTFMFQNNSLQFQ